jgi:hypothetical protein
MMRHLTGSLAVFLVGAALAAEAHAAEPPGPPPSDVPGSATGAPGPPEVVVPRRHVGIYVRAGAGVGLLGDAITADGQRDRTASGMTLAYEGAVGGTPVLRLALGAGVWGGWVPDPSLEVAGSTEPAQTASLMLHVIGAHADYYFTPSGGFHVQALVGYAFLTGAAGDAEAPDGPGVGIGAGYEWWIGEELGLGLLGRVVYAPLQTTVVTLKESHAVTLPSLLLTFTYH